MQVRAICVQIAYHSKLEVSSLSGDSKNAPLQLRYIMVQVLHLLRCFTHTPHSSRAFKAPTSEMKVKIKGSGDEMTMKMR